MILPTVIIESKNGPIVINQSDYNEEVHTLYDTGNSNSPPEDPEPPVAPKPAPKKATPAKPKKGLFLVLKPKKGKNK